MAWPTAGDIVNDAAVEIGLADSADPFNSTDANVVQLCRLLKSAGRELVQARNWTYLRREFTFTTVTGQSVYPMPNDYLRMYDQSGWNRTNRLPLTGPLSPQEWQYLKARLVGVVFTVLFRPMNRQMVIYPDTNTPGGYYIAYEYGSTSWVYSSTAPNVYPAWATGFYAAGSKIRYGTTNSDYWSLYDLTPETTQNSTIDPSTAWPNRAVLVSGTNYAAGDGLTWTYTGTGVEANADYPANTTDEVWFNPLLITRALKLSFLKAKGLDTTAAEQDYAATLNAAEGMDAPGKILNLTRNFTDPSAMPIGNQSVPITGFGT